LPRNPIVVRGPILGAHVNAHVLKVVDDDHRQRIEVGEESNWKRRVTKTLDTPFIVTILEETYECEIAPQSVVPSVSNLERLGLVENDIFAHKGAVAIGLEKRRTGVQTNAPNRERTGSIRWSRSFSNL
jgi:hypothetical protein